MWRGVMVGLLIVGIAVCLVPSSAFAQTPGNLDLTRIPPALADLPTGFIPVPLNTGFVSNNELARQAPDPDVVAARLAGWGRINGYNAMYRRDGFAAWVGTARITAQLGLYESAAGAQSAANFKEAGYYGLGYVDVSMPALGATSHAFTRTITASNDLVWREYLIQFTQGGVNASVATLATAGTSSFEETMEYARGMVARIIEGRTYPGI